MNRDEQRANRDEQIVQIAQEARELEALKNYIRLEAETSVKLVAEPVLKVVCSWTLSHTRHKFISGNYFSSNVSHSICKSCYHKEMQQIRSDARQPTKPTAGSTF